LGYWITDRDLRLLCSSAQGYPAFLGRFVFFLSSQAPLLSSRLEKPTSGRCFLAQRKNLHFSTRLADRFLIQRLEGSERERGSHLMRRVLLVGLGEAAGRRLVQAPPDSPPLPSPVSFDMRLLLRSAVCFCDTSEMFSFSELGFAGNVVSESWRLFFLRWFPGFWVCRALFHRSHRLIWRWLNHIAGRE